MPEVWQEGRPASWAGAAVSALSAGHPALRARLAEAIGSLLLDTSARKVGEWIGRKGETVTGRGDDVDAWPLSELRLLADRSRPVDEALRAYVCGEAVVQGEAIAAVGALMAEISQDASITAAAADALSDGRITAAEAANLTGRILDRRTQEDAVLLPALRAITEVRL